MNALGFLRELYTTELRIGVIYQLVDGGSRLCFAILLPFCPAMAHYVGVTIMLRGES